MALSSNLAMAVLIGSVNISCNVLGLFETDYFELVFDPVNEGSQIHKEN